MKPLHGKFKLFLYGFAGMGVNMLNLIIGSYLCDALMTEGFAENIENWTFCNKTIVSAALWSVMIAISKIVDGVIDIPFAAITDNLKCKFGKRRPAILVGFILMVISYLLFLNPISAEENSIANTIWFGVILCAFYAFYTLTMVTYYATFSEITDNEVDRLRLSNYKTVFDVVYFVLGYALIPALVGNINIRTIALIFLPLSLTMIIPMFLIKEHSTLPEDVAKREKEAKEQNASFEPEETVGLWTSLVYTVKNKSFMIWLAVYAFLQLGLQMFLVGQNVFYSGTMHLEGMEITLIMAFAFAPVPLTLAIYNKIVRNKGLRAGYIFAIAAYVIAMGIMVICKEGLIADKTIRIVLAIIGAVISSFGTGCAFSVNYTIPSTIADIELKRTGVSHPAMYFAVQGLIGGIATAISTGLIWVNLKDVNDGEFVWTMPLIVCAACIVSIILSLFMPKEINQIAKKDKD